MKAVNAVDPAHPDYFEDANTAPGVYLTNGSDRHVHLRGLGRRPRARDERRRHRLADDGDRPGARERPQRRRRERQRPPRSRRDLDLQGDRHRGRRPPHRPRLRLRRRHRLRTDADRHRSGELHRRTAAGISIVKAVNAVNPTQPDRGTRTQTTRRTRTCFRPAASVVWTYTVTNLDETGPHRRQGRRRQRHAGRRRATTSCSRRRRAATTTTTASLDKSETWIFTAPARTAVAGSFTNVATVQGTAGGDHVLRQRPGDATSAGSPGCTSRRRRTPPIRTTRRRSRTATRRPARSSPSAPPVVWTYQVTNTGNIALTISVRDDFGTATNAADDFTPRASSPATRTGTGRSTRARSGSTPRPAS